MTLHPLGGVSPQRAKLGLPMLVAGARQVRRRLAGGGSAAAVARVMTFRALTLLMNLATGIAVAAALGPLGRGELAALLLAPQFVGALCLFGLQTAFIYHAKADPSRAGRYFAEALLLSLPGTLIATAIAWAIMPFWLSGHDQATIALARLLLFIIPFAVATPLLTGVLDAHGRFGLSSAIQYLQPLGCAIALVPLIVFGALTPTSAAVAYTAPVLLSFAIAAWQAVRLLRPEPEVAILFRPYLLHYALKRYAFEVLATLAAYFDQLLVIHMLPAAAAGTYAVALSISRVLGVLQDSIFSVVFPGIAGRPIDEVMAVLGRAVRVSTLLATAIGSVLALFGPGLIGLLYGPKFAAAATPFRLLLAATVVQGVARLLSHAFTATGRPGPLTVIETIGIAATLLAMMVLLPRFGVDGAAAAALLGSLARLAGTVICLNWVLQVAMPRLIPIQSDLRWVANR